MNKQEVLYLPVKKEGRIFSTDNYECKIFYRTLDGEEVSSSFKAKSKEELLDQLKPVVPQFVAEWIDKHKNGKKKYRLSHALENVFDDTELGLYIKQQEGDYTETIAKAWIDGYTVEKEKLYTVEIPNPNSAGGKLVLFKHQSTGRLILEMLNPIINKPKYLQLTESEIKQDFEWAWQFALEVE
jgi:hypothetical protein